MCLRVKRVDVPAEFRRAEDGREGRGAARLELSTTRLYAQCGIARRAVCVGKKRRAGQGLAASSGKAKAHRPTDPPGLLHIQKAERGKGKRCRGQLSSSIMHSSHSSGPFFSTDIGTPEDLIEEIF